MIVKIDFAPSGLVIYFISLLGGASPIAIYFTLSGLTLNNFPQSLLSQTT
jgi:hypothetical protein